ncbi:MAG: lipocalin family protein [Gammaproteobacteria bacterium]|nr:lipocalin family protein [Gammaproteobacteria bacterium]MDH3933580.1 lipocalin family protein [Gammaproteobacteria bacterium]MDH3987334.1 lipocalin family protein [Gammaproteobacteria bacterium]
MKTGSFFKLLLAIILYTGGALSDTLSINPDEIIGKWHTTELHPDQGNIETIFIINADNTFSGTMTINNVPAWQYAGTWTLKGNQITWVYLESNIILLQEDKQDTDVILSVSDAALTYRSLRRGKESTLQRVK